MQNQNSSSGAGRIAWILLILSLLGNVYQWWNNSSTIETYQAKNDTLVNARADAERELAAAYDELNKFKGQNEKMDSLVMEANSKMDEQREKIKELLGKEQNTKKLNKKLTAEIEMVKKLRDQYLEKIDELLVENENLKQDKANLATTIETISKNLEATVNTASVLKSEYVKVKTYKKKSSGKYSETAMAKRTNKMEVCFSVLENKIAKAGEKTIYLKIVEPGGKTMGSRSEGSSTFKVNGSAEEVQFTDMKKIDYTNEKQDVCMNWEENERIFTPGTYLIEIYSDGNLSTAASYVMK